MFLVVPFVALCAFALSLLAWLGVVIHQAWVKRRGGATSARSLWWRRSLGQLTLVFFVTFVVTRWYYLF